MINWSLSHVHFALSIVPAGLHILMINWFQQSQFPARGSVARMVYSPVSIKFNM